MVIAELHYQANQRPEHNQFLIVGYGNEYHGDNGIGPAVANVVVNWELPWVKAIAISDLTLDLVADIAESRYVIFVNAYSRRCAQTIQISPIEPSVPNSNGHFHGDRTFTPSSLLSLAQTLYHCQTQVWSIQVAAEYFTVGSQLSVMAQQGCDRALRTIEQFFTTYSRMATMPSVASSHPITVDATSNSIKNYSHQNWQL